MGAPEPPVLPDLPANADLLAFLRRRACPPGGPNDLALGPWQLHTHPDLYERLAELAPHHPLHAAYGVPVLAAEGGAAAATALGTGILLVRLPQIPAHLAAREPLPPLTDRGWHTVTPWSPRGLTGRQADDRLSALLREALAHATALTGRG
ncbi:hypothetical protein [Kitasatospora sp. KL5]|uniref:hypothetical protein n=1 Tax=Kitasatospora sp. KL5 TaxID=3425125 RepID=UPI003D6EEFC8